MIFVFLIVVALALLAWQFKRAKDFESKETKDVITKQDVKAFLNMPHADAHFAEDLEKTRDLRKPSRKVLDEFNSLE